ncbi:MAG: GtrA family protein [Pseudomonadales bacterium]
MRVYLVFARFMLVSFTSFLVDISIFALTYAITSDIYVSTYTARPVSAVVNFSCNKYLVFQSLDSRRFRREFLSYVALVILVATTSAFATQQISQATDLNVVLIKVCVDSVLFVNNFLLQKFVLFARGAR